jgi:hypothetical protein
MTHERLADGSRDNMDRRVTRAFEWLSGLAALIVMALLGWVGSTLNDLQKQVAVLQFQIAPSALRMDRIETKIESMQQQSNRIETKVATMEARQVRITGQ